MNNQTEPLKPINFLAPWSELDRRGKLRNAQFKEKDLVIKIYDDRGKEKYEIDLERTTTKKELLDWIFHLLGKNWLTPNMLYDFLICLDDTCRDRFDSGARSLYLHNDEKPIQWKTKKRRNKDDPI